MQPQADYKIDFNQVRHAASHAWETIYGSISELGDALDRRQKNQNAHVECPVCGRKSFRLFKDFTETGGAICVCNTWPDGFMLLRDIWRLAPTETYKLFADVADILGGDYASPDQPSRPPPARKVPKFNKRAQTDLKRVHSELRPIDDPSASPMRTYFRHRGLNPDHCPRDLMYHPALTFLQETDDGKVVDHGKVPAMVGIVRTPRGDIITLHRTFLTPEGRKQPFEVSKKIMKRASPRSVAGCCIQLDPASEVLHLAEGIETGLSVRAVTCQSTWVGISANYLPSFSAPVGVKHVVVWVDLDRSHAGHRFTQEMADRLANQGVSVTAFTPPGPIPLDAKSVDWNDLYRERGIDAFPHEFVHLSHSQGSAFEVCS